MSSVYWGALVHGAHYGLSDPPWDMTALSTFESHAGKAVSILRYGNALRSSGTIVPFDTVAANNTRNHGAYPLIDFWLWNLGDGATQPNYSNAQVTAGTHDAAIRQWAQQVKAWGHPVFLRFQGECNGWWYPWGTGKLSSGQIVNGNTVASFVPMWRHVHDLFAEEGVTNVTWIWSVNYMSDDGRYPSLAAIYPGDAYVDWVGISVYNLASNGANMSFEQLLRGKNATTPVTWMRDTYGELLSVAPNKPWMITEMGAEEFSSGTTKAQWFTSALNSLATGVFPKLKAFTYFNWDLSGTTTELIESSPAAQAAFAAGISSPAFSTNTFGSTSTTPIPPLGDVGPSTVSSGTDNTITWDPITGATSYVVQRSVAGADYTALATTTATSYTDVAAPADSTYTIMAQAADAGSRTPQHAIRDGAFRLIYLTTNNGVYKMFPDTGEVLSFLPAGAGEQGHMVGYAGFGSLAPPAGNYEIIRGSGPASSASSTNGIYHFVPGSGWTRKIGSTDHPLPTDAGISWPFVAVNPLQPNEWLALGVRQPPPPPPGTTPRGYLVRGATFGGALVAWRPNVWTTGIPAPDDEGMTTTYGITPTVNGVKYGSYGGGAEMWVMGHNAIPTVFSGPAMEEEYELIPDKLIPCLWRTPDAGANWYPVDIETHGSLYSIRQRYPASPPYTINRLSNSIPDHAELFGIAFSRNPDQAGKWLFPYINVNNNGGGALSGPGVTSPMITMVCLPGNSHELAYQWGDSRYYDRLYDSGGTKVRTAPGPTLAPMRGLMGITGDACSAYSFTGMQFCEGVGDEFAFVANIRAGGDAAALGYLNPVTEVYHFNSHDQPASGGWRELATLADDSRQVVASANDGNLWTSQGYNNAATPITSGVSLTPQQPVIHIGKGVTRASDGVYFAGDPASAGGVYGDGIVKFPGTTVFTIPHSKAAFDAAGVVSEFDPPFQLHTMRADRKTRIFIAATAVTTSTTHNETLVKTVGAADWQLQLGPADVYFYDTSVDVINRTV